MKFQIKHFISASDNFLFESKFNQYLEVDSNGKISELSDYTEQQVDKIINGLVIPGLANAHSHAYQIAMRGTADNPKNFKDWVDRYLYPTVENFNEEKMRKNLRLFFKLILRNGITTLGEFHYFHHLQATDFKYDQIFLEEAKESGIRLSFLQSAYDLGNRNAQSFFHSNPDQFIQSLEQISKWINSENLSDQWSLSTAPHSLHGCSEDLIRIAVDWANNNKKHWHIHLAEQKSDIDYSLDKYGLSPLMALNKILDNKLDQSTCLVHACWLNNDEIDLFNERNLNLVYNPFTNMYLGDGITASKDLSLPKSKIALGTDSNNAFNMFTEAKLLETLQRIKQLEMGQIKSDYLLAAITAFAEPILNLSIGKIQTKYFADFIEIDFQSLTGNDSKNCSTETILNHLVFSGMDSSFINSRFIGGKEIAL